MNSVSVFKVEFEILFTFRIWEIYKSKLRGFINQSNDLVVKMLDSQSRGPVFKATGWLQGRLSRSSFRGRQNEYQSFLGT